MAAFRNNYYLMRHGQSQANVAGKIVSDPAIGCQQFGLTKLGLQQVENSVKNYTGEPLSIIICSDFMRTRQTAELVTKLLALPSPLLDIALRERFFGNWEGQSDDSYEVIWEQDQRRLKKPPNEVEAVDQVLERGLKLIHTLENTHLGETLLLVSHGDMLQILQTIFTGKEANEHRLVPHHQTAEIRPLVFRGEKFPEDWPF